jgi:2-haloacid dehalogenase
MALDQVKALVFDVFGTVVDWRGSVIAEGEALARSKGLQVDWSSFADEWRRQGYHATIAAVLKGELPWVNVDAMMRRKLDELIQKYQLRGLSETETAHFAHVWRRLHPWPDSVAGLSRLKQKFIISPLSNGNFALLTNMGKFAGLPWDCIISTDLFQTYKPDPATYQGAARLLDLQTDEVMLVAAHVRDLRAAQAAGLHAAFVRRPLEWGAGGPQEPDPDPAFDLVASDFLDLAARLGV